MVEASKYKKVVPYANIENVTEAIKTEESAPADSIDLPTGGVIGIDDIEASEQAVIAPGPEGGDNDTRKAIELVSVAHGKEDEQYLKRFFAPGEHCRTSILDAAFGSPAHPTCISVNGCDNCIRRRIKELEGGKSNKTQDEAEPIKQELLDLDLNTLDTREAAIQDLRSRLFPRESWHKETTSKV
ncbi:hypothetical protein RSOL_195660, partial [Rhizoctonia solani AG-3 Rhs1AP]